MSEKKKVFVAMSGGVDSSVAAAILRNNGYDVHGVFLNLGQVNLRDALKSVKKTAQKIGIPLKIIDLRKRFKKEIIDYFLKGYKKGITPNPCAECNKRIKFGFLFNLIKKQKDFCYLSTGHYVRLLKGKILQAKDKEKDQSYFLYNIKQEQLARLLFPLGNYTKEEVKKTADKRRLPYLKKESQDICFLPCGHNEFLRKNLKFKKGKVITANKKTIGKHEGLPLYTIGQRHGGFSVGGGIPYYVVAKDIRNNLLIVADKISEKKFYKKEVGIENVNWISGNPPSAKKTYKARIRYRQPLQACKIIMQKEKDGINKRSQKCRIIFYKSQRAVTPGQSLVIYDGKTMLGGGIIK
jgi:tRNA-specific 2-thiouridylase